MDIESDNDLIETIIRDFLSKLCHNCIEDICNNSLNNVLKLKIDSPRKKVNYYLLFLKENIMNIQTHLCEGRCKDGNHEKDYYSDSNHSEVFEDSSDDRKKLTIEQYHKINNMLRLDNDKKEKKLKKKKKKKTK